MFIEIINEEWDQISELTKVPKAMLISIILHCFELNYFTFHNRIYLQIDGMSIGNPASPTIANLVMNYVIKRAVELLKFDISLVTLYVDDLLFLIPKNTEREILEIFNSINVNIQFTMECEKDGVLPYLDIKIIRRAESIITDWYVKPTSVGRILNFKSNHPTTQKLGMIHGCSDTYSRVINLSGAIFH